MSLELSIEIPGHPISANKIWRGAGKHVYKTPEARGWESLAFMKAKMALSRQHGLKDLAAYKGKAIKLEMDFFRSSWKGKTKATRELYVRPDVSNFIKLCEDSIMKALGLDDSAVIELIARKVEHPGLERTLVRITLI